MSFLFTDASQHQANNGEGPSVTYVNEVVLKEVIESGIRLTPDCRVTNDRGLSAAEFVDTLMGRGWSWPRAWYRQNRNYFAHDSDARHFEKEVEPRKWIHIVVSPGLRREELNRRVYKGRRHRTISDWSLPPRSVELHAENGWLRPSSYEHLRQYLKQKLWPF